MQTTVLIIKDTGNRQPWVTYEIDEITMEYAEISSKGQKAANDNPGVPGAWPEINTPQEHARLRLEAKRLGGAGGLKRAHQPCSPIIDRPMRLRCFFM